MTKKQKNLVEEIKAKLAVLAESEDYEVAHPNADGLLCALLTGLGLGDVVDVYNKVGKWYS